MKRLYPLVIIVLLFFALASVSAAAGETVEVTYGSRIDYQDNPGYLYFRFAPEPYPPGVSRQAHVYHYKDTLSGDSGFCLHPALLSAEGSMQKTSFYEYFPKEDLQRLEIAVALGFHEGLEGFEDENLKYMFTQRLIWETIPVKYYGSNPDFLGTMGTSIVTWRFLDGGINRAFNELYDSWKVQLDAAVEESLSKPLFSPQWLEMKKRETRTLVDENQRLSDYQIEYAPHGVDVQIEGNSLHITATSEAQSGEIVLSHRKFDKGISFVYAHDNPDVQDLGIFRVSAPLDVSIILDIEEDGTFTLSKKSSAGDPVSGATFSLYSDALLQEELQSNTTDEEGRITFSLLPEGRYYLIETSVPPPFLIDEAIHAIDVQAGETTELTLFNEEPKGRIRIVKSDAFDDRKLEGALFSIRQEQVEIEKIATNSEGVALSSLLPLGEYTVVEIEPPSGYVENAQEITVVISYQDPYTPVIISEHHLKNERSRFPLSVEKKSIIDLEIPLDGGTFAVYCSESFYPTPSQPCDDMIAEVEATDGIITLPPLEPGKYMLIELEAPEGYEINPLGIKWILHPDGSWEQLAENGEALYEAYVKQIDKLNTLLELQGNAETVYQPLPFVSSEGIVFYNAPKLSRIQLSKHLEETEELESGEKTPEAGIHFRIEDEYGKIVDRLVTAENGFASSGLLPHGKYTIIQESVTDGFLALEPFEVVLGEQLVTLRLENAPILSQIRLVKIDAWTKETIPQAGMRFSLYREETGGDPIRMKVTYPQVMELHEFVTDESGTLTFPEKLPFGTYWLEEVEGPLGYFLDPESGRVEVSIDSTEILIHLENIPQTGVLEVEKYGKQFLAWETVEQHGYLVTVPRMESSYLQGVRFALEKNGEIIHEFETGEEIYRIEDLPLGTYTLRELEAPSGYLRDDNVHEIVFTPQEAHQRIHLQSKSISNVLQRAIFTFHKEMEESLFLGDEVLEEVLFGLYNAEELMGLEEGTLMGVTTLNQEGEGIFEALLQGEYYLKELATHDAYVIHQDIIPVSFSFSESEGEEQIIAVEVIQNELKRGFLRVMKVESDTGRPLPGARFVLEAEADGERVFLAEVVTDAAGIFDWEFVYGKYFIREKDAPEGYKRSAKEWGVEVKGEEDLTLRWENEPTCVEVKKIDQETKAPLRAVFHVFSGTRLLTFKQDMGSYRLDPEGSPLIESDEEGLLKILALPSGTYSLEEVSAPAGYVLSEALAFDVEEELALTIENRKSTVTLVKTDKTNNTGLQAGFLIKADDKLLRFEKRGDEYHLSEEGSATVYSDKNGSVVLRGLSPGNITIEEVEVPEGYQKADIVHASIQDGSVIRIVNHKIPKLPDTGDRTELAMRTASVLILLGVLLFLWKSKSAQ
ncbi:MAG TPA: hypothetical protein GX733_02590 [Tissierellia bacterium]|nr:hypothetical protein [Tissierellia bacterium]